MNKDINKIPKEAIALIISAYYFDGDKLTENYTKKLLDNLNQQYGLQLEKNYLEYQLSRLKLVDPLVTQTNKVFDPNDKLFTEWNYYINEGRVEELRRMHVAFKKSKSEVYSFMNIAEESSLQFDLFNKNINKLEMTYTGDYIKPKYDYCLYNNEGKPRSAQVKYNAIFLAEFKCEFNKEHVSFINKSNGLPYTEGHHLIPLAFQDDFNNNLDVEANIVSLCPVCHKKIHYGKNIVDMLSHLFDLRCARLKDCGISITKEKLIALYEKV